MATTKKDENLNHSFFAADYLAEKEFASLFDASLRTVRRWESLRLGPPRTIIGRKVFYRREAVQNWLRSKEQKYPEARKRARRVA